MIQYLTGLIELEFHWQNVLKYNKGMPQTIVHLIQREDINLIAMLVN